MALSIFCVLYGFTFGLFGQYIPFTLLLPLFVPFLLMVWVLPDRDTAPEGLLEGLLYGYLIALLVWPEYLALALPGLPWLTAQRVIGTPMVAILMISLSMSPPFRRRIVSALRATPGLWQMLALLTFLVFVSCFISEQPFASLNRFLIMLLYWIGPFLIGVALFAKDGRPQRLGLMLWGITLVDCTAALWESHIRGIPWAGHIPNFLQVDNETVAHILLGSMRAWTDVYRAQSRFETPLAFAEFLSLVLPFVLHFAVVARGTKRIMAVASVCFVFYVAYLSNSRSGIIGFFVAILGYTFFLGLLRWRNVRGSIVGPALTLGYPVGAAIFVAATFVVGRLRNLVWGDGSTDSSNDARRQMYEMGWPKILHNPFGYGIGRSGLTLGYYSPGGQLTVDSYYLTLLLEIGIFGFLLYMAMFLYATGRSAMAIPKARSEETYMLIPCVLLMVNFVIIKGVHSGPENHPLVFLVLGMMAALVARVARENAAPDAPEATGIPQVFAA